jgi:hypothetical protein
MTTDSRLMRWATGIADLDNPFLTEERQRAVVYEASTVGLNVVAWTSMIVVAVAFWAGGYAAWNYVYGMLLVFWTGPLVTWWYARRHGVTIPLFTWSSRPRPAKIADIVLGLALLTGMLRAMWQELGVTSLVPFLFMLFASGFVAIGSLFDRRSNRPLPVRGHDGEDDRGQ